MLGFPTGSKKKINILCDNRQTMLEEYRNVVCFFLYIDCTLILKYKFSVLYHKYIEMQIKL